MRPTPCVALHELGQSVWLDNINDGLIESGELARLIAEGSVYGVTSNPTIFKNAIAGERFSYPAEIARLAGAGKSPHEIYDLLAVRDITRTADLLAETYRRGTGRDGFVSLEVPPALSRDTRGHDRRGEAALEARRAGRTSSSRSPERPRAFPRSRG